MTSKVSSGRQQARYRSHSASEAANPKERGHTWTRIGEGGRIVIPADVRAELGLSIGDKVFLDIEDGVLRVMTADAAIEFARQLLAPALPTDRSLADELIAERRAEAARE